MTHKTLASALLFGLTTLGSGCYTTKIYTAATPQMPSPLHQGRWHHAVILGLAEVSEPVDLDAACPQGGWAAIDEEYSFLNGLVASVTFNVYSPRTYTVHCGAGGGAGAGSPNPWTEGTPPVAPPPQ